MFSREPHAFLRGIIRRNVGDAYPFTILVILLGIYVLFVYNRHFPPAKMALQDNQGIDVWAPILLLVVALITFAARVYVRVTDKTFGLDDSLMSLGSFFYIFQCTTVIGGGVAGIGLRNEHITGNAQYVAAGRWFYFNVLAYSIAACFVRLSILVTLLRIVRTRGYKYSIYVAMVAIVAIALQGVIFLLIQCKPISWYWDKSTGSGSCFSSSAVRGNTIATTFVPAATDVFSAILPIVLLWNIQMNWRSKFLVCIMLGLGAFGAVTIIVRLPAIVDLQDHQDSLYSVAVSVVWGCAETGIGIIAASLSTIRRLFRSWTGTTVNNTQSHSYNLGTMPGTGGRLRSTARTDGMERLPDAMGHEAWKGDRADGFNTRTNVSTNLRLAKRDPSEASEYMHGDSNSETEILDIEYRQKGIKMQKTFVVETTKGVDK